MDEDVLYELVFFGFAVVATIVVLIARQVFKNRVVRADRVRVTGGPGEFEVAVVQVGRGRHYVSIEYTVPGDDDTPDKDMQIILTSTEAARLASHLRVASQRRGTLTMARVAARRAAQADAPSQATTQSGNSHGA